MDTVQKAEKYTFFLRVGSFLLDWAITAPIVFFAVGVLIPQFTYGPEEIGNAEGLAFFVLAQLIMPHEAALMAVGPYLEALLRGPSPDHLSFVTMVLFFAGILIRILVISLLEILGKGRSLGKKAMGLTMTQLPWYGYFLRNLCRELSFHYLLGIPFLVGLFRRDGKTAIDLKFKTQVLPVKK